MRVAAVLAGLLLAGCAVSDNLGATVVSTAGTIGVGEQRVLVELRDTQGVPVEVGSVPNATLRDENGSPLGVYPGELVWAVPDEHPMYVFVMDIPEPETYQITVDAGESGETRPSGFNAVAEPLQTGVGETPPPLAGETVVGPVLVVFASPDRCPSQSCRPMIEMVEAAAQSAGVSWRLVEVFEDPDVVSDEDLVLSADVEVWGIPSQPWLYVVDGTGLVTAAFEGAVSPTELTTAVEQVSP